MPTYALDHELEAGVQRIRDDPVAFTKEWLGDDPWEKQIEIAEAVRDHRRTSVKSCHASGKSFWAARVVVWFLHAFPGSVALTTAPTQNQVRNILWRNIAAAKDRSRKPLLGRCLQTEYEIAKDWYGLGFKAEDTRSDRFQGFHAEHALVVIDEAAGVTEPVYEALDAVMTSEGARMLLIGNPTNPSGTFYESFHSAREIYHNITIAASDTPNIKAGKTIRPYLITQQWIDDAIKKHGEDSPYVEARVHARFPKTGDSNLIPLAWIEAAHERTAEEDGGAWEAGLDVARFGGDQSAICVRQGIHSVFEDAWSGMDTMATVGKVKTIIDTTPQLKGIARVDGIPSVKVKVDVIGIGAGVADRLREDGWDVVDVNVSASSRNPEQFANLRHELWWSLRESFREGGIAGPLEDATMGQLSSVRYRYDSKHSRPVIESKDEMKKRGISSPDRAEAMMLAFTSPPHLSGQLFF